MIDVILHIGRHKTGTSSLQRFLFENPELLRDHNLVYPKIYLKNIAHHMLSEQFRPSEFEKLNVEAKRKLIAQTRTALRESLVRENVTYIISSEAFQNTDPKIIREVFDPDIFNVTVVCYFRDQISYLASAYNQRIHATTYSGTIYEYYRDFFRANYLKFAKKWSKYFDSLVVRKYEREALCEGDLIYDFFRVITGVDLVVNLPVNDGNPSLSGKLVLIKREINRGIADKSLSLPAKQHAIYQCMAEISDTFGGPKFKVPSFIALIVFFQYFNSNRVFFNNYMTDAKGFSMKPFWESLNKVYKVNSVTSSEVEEVLKLLKKKLDQS